jgi:hypothetical protein
MTPDIRDLGSIYEKEATIGSAVPQLLASSPNGIEMDR